MSFEPVIQRAYDAVKNRGVLTHPHRWQSTDVSANPAAATYEVLNHTLQCQVPTEDLAILREQILPNLPWADDHFLERVGGVPLNPGVEWARWPWANKADTFRVAGGGQFSHTYMERYWPKLAGGLTDEQMSGRDAFSTDKNQGLRYDLGDLGDVVTHLAKDPTSRQAYLPIFFPEDTGKLDVRVPCTLGYHVIMRHGYLHLNYYIRSCDLYRHLRDDVYLTVRLQLWILDQLRERDARTWSSVKPGLFTMYITSLHLFVNDATKLWGRR